MARRPITLLPPSKSILKAGNDGQSVVTRYEQYSHCSYCGHPFAADQDWPRSCRQCGNRSYLNPLPVSVVLLPVEQGLLAVRRDLDPGRGELALPGGFIELPETWQEAGARELKEETGVEVDAHLLSAFRVYSAPDGTLLVFGLAPPWRKPLPPFESDGENTERVVICEPCTMAFSLHTLVVEEYFSEKGSGS